MQAPASIRDLSHPLATGMPVFPGSDPVRLAARDSSQEEGFAELSLTLSSHSGTHLDAPRHMLPAGATLEQLPVKRFLGPAVVLHLAESAVHPITLEQLLTVEGELKQESFLLLATGWDRHWGMSRYFTDSPWLEEEAARWLAERRLAGVGCDFPSLDPLNSSSYPVHRQLLGVEILLIENLRDLCTLPRTGALFCCLPLPLAGGDGSPVRAVAML